LSKSRQYQNSARVVSARDIELDIIVKLKLMPKHKSEVLDVVKNTAEKHGNQNGTFH